MDPEGKQKCREAIRSEKRKVASYRVEYGRFSASEGRNQAPGMTGLLLLQEEEISAGASEETRGVGLKVVMNLVRESRRNIALEL